MSGKSVPELFALDSLTDDEERVLDAVRGFGDKRLRPGVAQWFEAGTLPVRDLPREMHQLTIGKLTGMDAFR